MMRRLTPLQPKHGWQNKATWVVDFDFRRHTIFPAFADDQVLLRCVFFIAIPSMKETRIDPQPFRLLFLRHSRLPLPLQVRSCRCGRPLDVLGHHRAACADAGVLGRLFPLEWTPPWFALSRDGVAQRCTATTHGKSLARARRREDRTYIELTGEHGRARLGVLGVEVGGRWFAETSVFLRSLAAVKARGAPP